MVILYRTRYKHGLLTRRSNLLDMSNRLSASKCALIASTTVHLRSLSSSEESITTRISVLESRLARYESGWRRRLNWTRGAEAMRGEIEELEGSLRGVWGEKERVEEELREGMGRLERGEMWVAEEIRDVEREIYRRGEGPVGPIPAVQMR